MWTRIFTRRIPDKEWVLRSLGLVALALNAKFLYRRNDSDLEFGDPQPFVDSCLYQSAFRLAYAPTFQQVVKYLPLCDIFKNTFEKEDQYMRRVGPIYHVLSLDSRVSYDSIAAEEAWEAQHDDGTHVLAIPFLEQAKLYAADYE